MSDKFSQEELVHVISSIIKQMNDTQELLHDTIGKTNDETGTALKVVHGLLHTITGLTLTLMTYEPVVLMKLAVEMLAQSIEVDQKLEIALAYASMAILAQETGEEIDPGKIASMLADMAGDDNVIGPALYISDN